MIGHRSSIVSVVVGAAFLATGVMMSTMPASAQLHSDVLHIGVSESLDAMGNRLALAQATPVADCVWQRQRYWDGYGWRSQRVRMCD